MKKKKKIWQRSETERRSDQRVEYQEEQFIKWREGKPTYPLNEACKPANEAATPQN
jgi:deoxyribodipyrimidine photolyase